MKERKGVRTKELFELLWVYKTTTKTPTIETTFALAYERQAVILTKKGMPSFRIQQYKKRSNKKGEPHLIRGKEDGSKK